MVPFGNAKFENGQLVCQHGEEECKANSWEQCAIHLYPEFEQYFPFYLCIEESSVCRSRIEPRAPDDATDGTRPCLR